MTHRRLTLMVLPGEYAVCRLSADEGIPAWATRGELWSAARTQMELSIVCAAADVPGGVRSEFGWRIFRLEGPFDFSLTGILDAVLAPLARAEVAIFAFSTFDTDYVMVKEEKVSAAQDALVAHGHRILMAGAAC